MSFFTRATANGVEARRVLAAVIAVSVIATLTACGRRGDPEPPPSAAVLSTDEQGNVVKDQAAPPKPDRRFILDPLLD